MPRRAALVAGAAATLTGVGIIEDSVDGFLSGQQAKAGDRPLTADDLIKVRGAILAEKPRACPHAVHPDALYRPGLRRCAMCGALVDVPYPLSER